MFAISDQHLAEFHADGFLVSRALFDDQEMSALCWPWPNPTSSC